MGNEASSEASGAGAGGSSLVQGFPKPDPSLRFIRVEARVSCAQGIG